MSQYGLCLFLLTTLATLSPGGSGHNAQEPSVSTGVTMTGRVLFAGPADDIDPARLVVYIFDATNAKQRRLIETFIVKNPLPTAPVQRDGRFVLEHVPPGQYQFEVGGPIPPGWRPLESAMVGTVDTLDTPLVIASPRQEVPEVLLTFAPTRSSVNGRVISDTPTEYSVVLIPSASIPTAATSQRLQIVQTDSKGFYGIHNLPPGKYVIGATRLAGQPRRPNDQILESVRQSGQPFELARGVQQTLDIKPRNQ